MKIFFNRLHYKQKLNLAEKILIFLLFFPRVCYELVVKIRLFLYKHNILKKYKVNALTISVGNLTTGGVGKTPITAALSKYYKQKGYKIAILSRGYGSKLNIKNVNVLSDGEKIYFDAGIGGDEPYWLAKNCPGVAVLCCASRVKSAKYAVEKLNCDVLIIDDGYQHLQLDRDINLLLIDSIKVFGNKKSLPQGPLRESLKEIERADKIVIVDKANSNILSFMKDEMQKLTQKEIIICKMLPDKIYNIKTEEEINEDKKVLAFSAIAQTSQFYNLLTNFDVVKTIDFPDHHKYTQKDVDNLLNEAKNVGAEILITTEKDAVKLQEFECENIFALKLKNIFY